MTGTSPWVDLAETHSAVVFFVGDRAYKLKKPVRFDFLDFSTPELREQAVRRELALNRRIAPDVYLGISEIHDVEGAVCDHIDTSGAPEDAVNQAVSVATADPRMS